jgi:PAS domain S-box-containing protein
MSTMAKNDPIPVDDQSLFFRQIVDLSPALLHTARPDGYLDFFNQTWLDFAGVPLERLLGWSWTSCIHPEDVEALVQKMREYFAKGKPFQETSRVRRADGVYRWMLHQKVPIFDGGGNIIKWYGSSIDIDDRKKAEEQLVKSAREMQRNEFYLSEAQRLGHIGSWVFDPATGFEHWSRELFQIHGLDPAKGPPDSEQYLALVHPEDREFMASLMKRKLLADSGFDVTKRIVRAGGEVRHVRCVGTAVSGNAPSKRMGVGIDVTDHEVLTQELRRREAYLAEAQRLGHVGSWVFEPRGAFEYWSHELFRIYGLDPERDAPTLDEYLACVHPHDREFMASLIKRMIAEASGCDVTKRIVRPNGEVRHIRCVGAPVLENGTLKRIVGNAIDVTEHELLTRELRRREAYLAEAQRLSHTGSFGWNPDTGEIVWSDETYRIFEYDCATKPTLDMVVHRIHPQDRALAQQVIDRASQTGTDFEQEYRLLLADGRVKHVHAIAHASQDASGNREFIGAVTDITVRKMAEEALRSSEEYLLEAQRLTRTGSWAWSPVTGDIRYWSEECYRVLGFDPAGPPPRFETFFQRIHPDDQAAARERYEKAIRDKAGFQVDYRIIHPDGETRNIHAVGHPTLSPSGDLTEFVGTAIDVTDRLRAEEKIRRNEKELRTLIEAIPAYVGTNLPDGSVDFMSQSWLDYTGFSREQGMGWGWASAIHPEDFDRVVGNWRSAVDAGAPVEHELRCRRSDGSYHWFLFRSFPLRDDGGNILKWYGTLTNIDALKETEGALQMREHELLGIIETIPSMLWSASPAGEVTYINQKVLEYCGVTLEEYTHRKWVGFLHPDDREESAKAFLRAIETGESYNVTYRVRRADGEYRWQQTRAEPLRDPHGKIIQWYGLSIDIDERKRAEDHLRDTGIKLAKASRLATVAELAGSIAHELNQPLMSILANAQAAKRWLNAAPPNVTEVNSSIERIIRDARAADETMQHIRALFKQASFDKKDVNIPYVIREVVRIVHEDPKKRDVPIECHFEESLPAVPVDQIQIQQVFINLIVNAIEALEGQQVAPLVVLRAATDSKGMLIQVIDNGPGVDDSERVFDAFMTTKEKGMGIGLAVSRSIVEAHGGRLWAENNKAGGATFSVALPLSHASP